MLNLLLLDWVDLLCDVGDTIVNILTLGQVGGDGCQLEIPIYVGWAASNSGRISSLFGHEIGHIMGLVGGLSPNGAFTDNYSHSVNDELDGGECRDSGVTFNWEKSLYRQPGVTEPVVNPLTGAQFLPLEEQNQKAARGKAIMSYACNRGNNNSFFEPVDVPYIFLEFAASSTRNFIHNITPGGGLAREASRSKASYSKQHLLGGERLYVSGSINQANNTGELRRVELLSAENALDASYGTGYWLVQLDESNNELARTGILPLFATAEDDNNEANDTLPSEVGFFAATLLRQEGMTRLELRHDETVLDTFSVGSAIPSVSISSPAGGTYDSGTIPVTWTAQDADGDALEIVIEYSADGGTSWMPIAFSSGSGTEEVPVAQLAGSTEAHVRVIASDGLNSSNDISDAFTVAEQPPRPYIGNPLEDSTFMEGKSIMLSGKAEDNQDGLVADGNLQWHSSRDGDLGSGSELSAVLSVGPHLLTLEA